MRKTIVTIERLEAGQPRPYADSKYRARIKAEKCNGTPKYLTEDEVKQLTRMFVHDFKDEPEWYESMLKTIRAKNPKMNPQKSDEWEVLVVSPYLD